ncbi:hypothetical protein D9M70_534900 [compost metagenome]
MSGKGQFLAGGEDPELRRMRSTPGPADEHRLRQVEFLRDRLHRLVVQPIGAEDHSQWIAFELPVGKDVVDRVTQRHSCPLAKMPRTLQRRGAGGKG